MEIHDCSDNVNAAGADKGICLEYIQENILDCERNIQEKEVSHIMINILAMESNRSQLIWVIKPRNLNNCPYCAIDVLLYI